MLRVMILAISVTALAAFCFGDGDDGAVSTSATTKGAPPATKAVPKAAERPPAQTLKPVVAVPKSQPVEKTSNVAETVTADRSPDEDAIRATGDSFEKAYDEADAKRLAAHFTPDAEYIDEQGNVYQGREAIEAALAACFAGKAAGQMEMNIDSLRFVSPGVAIEDGSTTVISKDGAGPVISRYTATHVKTNGQWLAASVREHAPKDRRQHRTQLQQLAWLQGEWVDEDEHSVVIFSCATADNGNFLLRKFTIQVAGQEALSGSQRIGWDPLTGKLRAWIFDSEGGYSDGFWHRDEDCWVLKSTGVTADGQPASSTSIYTFVDEHTMTWQSVDHEIAGVQLPDSELVTIVRRAPSPQFADDTLISQ